MGSISLTELIEHARQARSEHRLEDAKDAFLTAVAMGRKFHDKALLVQALTGLGQVERDLKNTVSAVRHYSDVVVILREQKDPLRLAHAIRHVADILREQGSRNKASPHYKEALAIYRSHEQAPPLDLANALRGYALLVEDEGHDEEATLLWQEALCLYERVSVDAGVAECQSHIAFLMGR